MSVTPFVVWGAVFSSKNCGKWIAATIASDVYVSLPNVHVRPAVPSPPAVVQPPAASMASSSAPRRVTPGALGYVDSSKCSS